MEEDSIGSPETDVVGALTGEDVLVDVKRQLQFGQGN